MHSRIALSLIAFNALFITSAWPASNIDATVPATDSALQSAPIRGNFATAKSEITALQGEMPAHVGAADPHSGYRLESAAVPWADLSSVPSAFTPSAHAASHGTGQADAISPASIGAEPAGVVAADITNSTTTGRSLITAASAAAARTTIGAAASATLPLLFERTISTPADADDWLWFRAPAALTLAAFHCISEGTTPSQTALLQECDANGGSCANSLSAAVTCAGTSTAGTISDANVASGAWMRLLLGAPSGTVDAISMTLQATRAQ